MRVKCLPQECNTMTRPGFEPRPFNLESSTQKVFYKHTCQLSRFSRESPSFSSNLPVSLLEHLISREIPIVAFFIFFFFVNLVAFEMSKRI